MDTATFPCSENQARGAFHAHESAPVHRNPFHASPESLAPRERMILALVVAELSLRALLMISLTYKAPSILIGLRS